MISKSIIESYKSIDYKIEVKLTYFRLSGKYYTDASYMEDYIDIYKIWERIENMKNHPELNGKWNGLILVEVPNHIHAHPVILNTKFLKNKD